VATTLRRPQRCRPMGSTPVCTTGRSTLSSKSQGVNSMGHVWKIVNSPFVIFLLSSVLVVSVTRFLDSRNARRVDAREQYRYVVECANRIVFVLRSWPDVESIRIWDLWNINAGLAASDENTEYHPLFKDFAGQPIDGLLTLLEIRQARYSLEYASVNQSISTWRDLTDLRGSGVNLVEDENADHDLPAQIRTYIKVPAESIAALQDLRGKFEQDYAFLGAARERIEKTLR
jgi:hypothetical protein